MLINPTQLSLLELNQFAAVLHDQSSPIFFQERPLTQENGTTVILTHSLLIVPFSSAMPDSNKIYAVLDFNQVYARGGQAQVFHSEICLCLKQGKLYRVAYSHMVKVAPIEAFSEVEKKLNLYPTTINNLEYNPIIQFESRGYLVMKKAPGTSLSQVMKHQLKEMSLHKKFELTLALMDAIELIHQAGIIHADINPNNIMIQIKGCTQLHIIDFGLAISDRTSLCHSSHSSEHFFWGTPQFASPEMVLGIPLDIKSDVYAVASIISLIFGATLKISVVPVLNMHRNLSTNYRSTLFIPELSKKGTRDMEDVLTHMSLVDKSCRMGLQAARARVQTIQINYDAGLYSLPETFDLGQDDTFDLASCWMQRLSDSPCKRQLSNEGSIFSIESEAFLSTNKNEDRDLSLSPLSSVDKLTKDQKEQRGDSLSFFAVPIKRCIEINLESTRSLSPHLIVKKSISPASSEVSYRH